MKTKLGLTLAIAALAACWLAGPPGSAGIPRPSFILYGQAADEYGWPYTAEAVVTLWINERSFETYAVSGMVTPGVNFVFRVALDGGGVGLPIDPMAAHTGDTFRITVSAFGEEKTLVPTMPFPKVGQPGEIIRINLTAGVDSNANGLPDEWEQWIVDHANNPVIKTIADVEPGDDADGDGVSNLQEYLAGTDPANAYDCFLIDQWEKCANGRLRLEFLTVPGKTYALLAAPLLAGPPYLWEPCPFAQSPTGAMSSVPIIGTGHYLSLFVEGRSPAHIFRVQVK